MRTIPIQCDYNALLSRMPLTQTKLIGMFVWYRGGSKIRRGERTAIATLGKNLLYEMKEKGLCDFTETLSKSGTKVLKRTWFAIKKETITK